MNVGEKIKKIRTDNKIKQADLAKKIGVPQSTLSKYETGNLRIDTDTIIDIANALDVNVLDLLDNTNMQEYREYFKEVSLDGMDLLKELYDKINDNSLLLLKPLDEHLRSMIYVLSDIVINSKEKQATYIELDTLLSTICSILTNLLTLEKTGENITPFLTNINLLLQERQSLINKYIKANEIIAKSKKED